MLTRTQESDLRDANPPEAHRDPITGAPGAHLWGTAIGTTTGSILAGATVGAIGGPVGAAVGLVLGGVAGALVGKQSAEVLDPTLEDAYWRDAYVERPYVPADASYEDYGPAFMLGAHATADDDEVDFAESRWGRAWEQQRGGSRLSWGEAAVAAQDGWDRVRAQQGRKGLRSDG